MPSWREFVESAWRKTPSVRALLAHNERLETEVRELSGQRDALVAERDELAAHCQRLSLKLSESLERERDHWAGQDSMNAQRDELAAERDELYQHAVRLDEERIAISKQWEECDKMLEVTGTQRDVLARERDELREHCVRLENDLDKASQSLRILEQRQRLLWAPPGHFYSPIVDPASRHLLISEDSSRTAEIAGKEQLRFDEEAMRGLLYRLSRFYDQLFFPKVKAVGHRYYYENSAFSYADAITLFAMTLEFEPRRIIEVGAGFSSAALMDIAEWLGGDRLSLSIIDPYPEALLTLIDRDERHRDAIDARDVQDVPLDLFEELRSSDMLLIDSSHVSKRGSDVNHLVFQVFPRLKPGVLIHIHDAFYPFEYPADWVTKENRSWNELYLIHAFLLYNTTFEILFFNDFVYNRFRAETGRLMPDCLLNTGGGLWLRKLTNRSWG
jgi:methyltransferase family protein